MAYYYVWYWEYSVVFPISVILILLCYFCCRVLCMKQVYDDRRQARRARTAQRTQLQNPNQTANAPQVYTISTIVVQDQNHPPSYKPPNSTVDLPPSYDEAIVLAGDVTGNIKQSEQV